MSNLDQKIENAANKIEAAANEAWEKRSFRIVSKSISAAAEIGLMIGAAHLSEKAINQQLLVCLLWVRQGLFVI